MSMPIRSSRIRVLAGRDTGLQIPEIARTRFRQTLQAPSDDVQSPGLAEEPPSGPLDRQPPADENAIAGGRDDIARLQHAAAVTMRSSATGESAEDRGAALQNRIARALVRQHRTETIIDSLVHSVAEFCRAPTIAQGGAWEIRLSIDPGVLPQTSLLLRLAAMQLQLRFECRDVASSRLLREHSKELREKLAAALREPYDIDIHVS